jgi:hypothetical protein
MGDSGTGDQGGSRALGVVGLVVGEVLVDEVVVGARHVHNHLVVVVGNLKDRDTESKQAARGKRRSKEEARKEEKTETEKRQKKSQEEEEAEKGKRRGGEKVRR